MTSLPPSSAPESERIDALRRYGILDTPPDGAFDRLTQLAAELLDVPIAIVSLVDTDRIWFKSHHGVDLNEIARDPGLCASAILTHLPYVVPDTTLDPRTCSNPLVTSEFGLRFYAAIPLQTPDHHNLGVLCVLDFIPREFTEKQLNILQTLASVVMDEIELRWTAQQNRELVSALSREQERIALAVRAGGVGIWELDPELDRFIWDQRMYELYGRNRGDFDGTVEQWLEFLDPADSPRVADEWFQCVATRKPAFESEFRIRLPSGDTRYIRARADLIATPTGALRAVGTNWDITAKKRVEASLRLAKEAAETAERSKGEFLAIMSHEIRTPMNGVMGFAELLRHTSLTPEQADYVQTITTSVDSLLRIVDDTLDFSRLEAGSIGMESRPFSLAESVNAVGKLLAPIAAQHGTELQLELSPKLPARIQGDAGRIRQVLINLIGNALKFTTEGLVTLRANPVATAPTSGKIGVEFSISDTGFGMTPEEVARLFHPFTQADNRIARLYGGSGLGLVISQKLVNLMGGTITVTSKPGQGSRFHFTLEFSPADPAPTASDEPAPALDRRFAQSHALRILVVDNDPTNRRLAKLLFEHLGYEPELANDGADAVAKARKNPPDFILMDELMPVMNGTDASRTIRAEEAATPTRSRAFICAFTADAQDSELRERCFAAGMDHYLTKPLRPYLLAAALATAYQQK